MSYRIALRPSPNGLTPFIAAFLSCCLAITAANAQQVQFALELLGGYDLYLNDETRTSVQPSFNANSLPDGRQVISEAEFINTQQWTLDHTPGADVRARLSFQISSRLQLTTGIGLSYRRAVYRSGPSSSRIRTLSVIDTLPPPPEYPPSVSLCDRFVIEGTNDPRTELYSWSLQVPLGLNYRFAAIPLSIGIQAYLRTPLFTGSERDRSGTRRERIDGETLCTFTTYRDTDRSGQDFNNVVAGIASRIVYHLSERWSLVSEFDRQLSATQVDPYSPLVGFRSNRPKIIPISGRFGILYHINP